MDTVWENARVHTWVSLCVTKLQQHQPKPSLAIVIPYSNGWLPPYLSLDPERSVNRVCYSLLYIHRKCCYLYWYTVMTNQLPSTRDYLSRFQTNLPGWKEHFWHNRLTIFFLCLRIWTVANLFCLFSGGQRQFGSAMTRRESVLLKIGWGGQKGSRSCW